MELLPFKERQHIEALHIAIQDLATMEEMEHYILNIFPKEVGANFASWNEHDEEMYLRRVATSASHAVRMESLIQPLNQTLNTHPLFDKYVDAKTGKSLYVDTVDRMRDYVSAEVYTHLPFYHAVAAPLDIVDQLLFHIYIKDGSGVVITLHGSDFFNDQNYLKMSLLRGHFVAKLYAIKKAQEREEEERKDVHDYLTNKITHREMEVLRLMCTSLCYEEIAIQLNISKRTIDQHAARIFHKLHAVSRYQIVARFGKWLDEGNRIHLSHNM